MSNQSLPHDIKLSKEIQRMILAGVPISIIFDKIKDMANAPRSLTTFYKIYSRDMALARAMLNESVGSKIMDKALVDGDLNALMFVAKTKLGWNDKIIVEERDPNAIDENTSAIDDLMAKLGIEPEEN